MRVRKFIIAFLTVGCVFAETVSVNADTVTISANAEIEENISVSSNTVSADAVEAIDLIPTAAVSERTFSIEADYVNYIDENEFVKASGNVLVVQGDVRLHTETATVNFHDKELSVADGFVFNRAQQQIYGRALEYDYHTQTAHGEDIGMTLMNSNIKGSSVDIYSDKIVIHDAYQTTCPDEENPCNHIEAKRMTIYPEWGNMVNDHAIVYVYTLPVVYVPNAVSDLNGDQDNTYASLPRLGYNPAEGNYIKFGMSFYQNEKLNGTLDLHYLTNLGFRTGFTNNYKLDQGNRGQVRAHYLSGLGGRVSYGWEHRMLLGLQRKGRNEIIDDFFRGILPPSKNDYPEFIFEINNREMIGYQWITYRPKLTLNMPAYELFKTGLQFTMTGFLVNQLEENVETVTTVGDVDFEDGTREYLQRNFEGNLYRDFYLGEGKLGRLTPGTTYSDSTYFTEQYLAGMWSRFIYYVNYEKNWDRLDFTAGYKYTPAERGFSPFNAETFYAGTSEENNIGAGWQVFENLKLNYAQYYSITEHKVRDRVYGGEIKLHCWKVQVNWSEYYSQFIFGVSMQP